MPLVLPNDLVNNSLADATPVEQNFNLIQGYINNEVIGRDGSVAMSAPLLLSGDPTQPNHAANKDYVDDIMPVGTIMMWPAAVAPTGNWMLCNGASLAKSSYPSLFGVLANNYGGTAGGGSFNLPNLQGRFPIGLTSARTELNTVGKVGGTFTVPVPAHSHPMPHTHTIAHTHEHPHTHGLNHDHGQFNSSGPTTGHRHSLSMRQTTAVGTTGSSMQAGTTGTTTSQLSGYDDDPHVHIINVPPLTGTQQTAQPNEATTGASSAGASGAVSTPNTSSFGTAGAEMQQPFLVLNFIIKAK